MRIYNPLCYTNIYRSIIPNSLTLETGKQIYQYSIFMQRSIISNKNKKLLIQVRNESKNDYCKQNKPETELHIIFIIPLI